MSPCALRKAVIERERRHIEAEVGRALDVGVAAEDVGAAAGHADVAGGEQQEAAGADVGRAGRELRLAHRPDQRRWFLMGEDVGDVLHLRFRQAGDSLHLGGRPFRDLVADLVQAPDPLADEFLVLPSVLENVPQHSVDGGDMGPGPHADVFSRVGGGPRHPRIDHDHIGAVELLAFEDMLQRNRMRLGGIAAHDEDGLGVADVVVAVRHRAIAPRIGHAGDGGRMANARLMIRVVRPPEGGKLAVEIGRFVGELGRPEPVDRIRPCLLADIEQLVADLVDRLIPGNPGPLAVHQLRRIAQATRAQHVVADRGALAAMRAAIDRAVVVGLLADPDAVCDFADDGAADRAMGADVLVARDRCAGGRWGPGIRLANVAERQAAEGRQASGSEARAAQEGAAIQAG